MTTPQKLSFTDVVKGIDLFDTVNVPSVAVVENMAYYDSVDTSGLPDGLEQSIDKILRLGSDDVLGLVEEGGLHDQEQDEIALRAAAVTNLVRGAFTRKRQHIFGKGHRGRLADMWGIENTIQMPLDEGLARSGDTGVPLVVSSASSELAERYSDLADAVVREVAKLKFSTSRRPVVSFQPDSRMITVETVQGTQKIVPADLRKLCRCALCVEEFSGKQLLDPASVPDDIVPASIAPVGNYAVSVQWDDGHMSLYPYSAFVEHYEPATERRKVNEIQNLV